MVELCENMYSIFWVKSNLTGTYTISLINDGTNNRQFVTEYTINTADTWEKKHNYSW